MEQHNTKRSKRNRIRLPKKKRKYFVSFVCEDGSLGSAEIFQNTKIEGYEDIQAMRDDLVADTNRTSQKVIILNWKLFE